MGDEINEKDLPKEGNSNARIYPPIEEAQDAEHESDPMQPAQAAAAAARAGAPSPHAAE